MNMAAEMKKIPPAPKRHADEEEAYYHTAPKCKGCPYGRHQYCVGICWKDAFERKRRKKKNFGDE